MLVYAHSVGCAPMEVSCVAPAAECSGYLSICSSDQSCPVITYMTCWEKLDVMCDDSYDSYERADCQPGYFDYDDPQDYEEWCAWNDVDEDEGYYAPFPPNVEGGDFCSAVVDSVGYEPSREEMPVSEGPVIDDHDDCGPETPFPGLVDSLNSLMWRISLGLVLWNLCLSYHTRRTRRYLLPVPGSDQPVPEFRLLLQLPDCQMMGLVLWNLRRCYHTRRTRVYLLM